MSRDVAPRKHDGPGLRTALEAGPNWQTESRRPGPALEGRLEGCKRRRAPGFRVARNAAPAWARGLH
jgi:hypothetical protein